MLLPNVHNRAAPTAPATGIAWPLRVSANKRYLEDQNSVPFYVAGDSTQTLSYSVSDATIDTYIATRKAQGFNANWVNMWGDRVPTLHGKPFTSGNGFDSDISTPNEAYWQHIDSVLNRLKAAGILAMFDGPGRNGTPSSNWQTNNAQFLANGAAKINAFGTWIANRYKNQGNIVWHIGNDLNVNDMTAAQISLVHGWMAAVRAADTGHHPMALQRVPNPNYTYQTTQFRDVIDFSDVYTYNPQYDYCKRAYQALGGIMPALCFETLFEDMGDALNHGDNGRHGYRGTPLNLRKALFWATLWGATAGFMYGNEALFDFDPGHENLLNSTGAVEFGIGTAFLRAHRAWELIPDYGHLLVTAGFGAFPVYTAYNNPQYTTATATVSGVSPDKTTAVIYMESARNATVNFSQLAGPAEARWFNPSTGAYTSIGVFNGGSHVLVPPSARDWCVSIRMV